MNAGRSLRLTKFLNPLRSCNMEPTTGIEPVNLILTKDVLYQLSYVGP
jgi:hypothetical protein